MPRSMKPPSATTDGSEGSVRATRAHRMRQRLQATARPGWGSAWTAAALLALLVLIYLYKPILTGGYYFPSGDGGGWPFTRLPGADYPPFNLRQVDMFLDTGPWLRYNIASVHAGHLPLWNAYNGAGVPHLANLQSGVFSPWNLPFYVLPFRISLIASAFFKLWALGMATWLFLRSMRLSPLAALTGATGYMFGGMHMLWLNWEMPSSVFVLPFGCLCLMIAARAESARRRRCAFAGLAVGTAASLLAGQIEIFAWAVLLVAAFAVFVAVRYRSGIATRVRYLAGTAGVLILALGLSAVQLIPFLQYMAGSRVFNSRSHGTFLGTFPAQAFGMMLFPNLAGPISHPYGQATLQAHFAEQPTTSCAGLAITALGLIGLAWLRRPACRAPVLFFLLVAALVVVLESNTTVAGWWHRVPALGTDLPLRSGDLVLFPIAFLAACGVDVLRSPLSARARGAAAAVVAAALAGAGVIALWTWDWLGRIYGVSTGVPAHEQYVIRQSVLLLGVAGTGLTVVIVLAGQRGRGLHAAAGMVLVATVWATSAAPWLGFNPTSPAEQLYPRTATMQQLRAQVGDDRVIVLGRLLPEADTNLDYRIATGTSYDAIDISDYAKIYLAVTHKSHVSTPDAGTSGICAARLRLLGLRWVVGGSGSAAGRQLPLARRLGPSGTPLYRVPDAQTFQLAQQVSATSSDSEALARVLRCDRTPGSVLVDAPAADLPPRSLDTSSANGTVRVLQRAQQHIVLSVSTPSARWLIARQTYFPGWYAAIDGKPTILRRADVAFQAVFVPAGTHRVILDYRAGIVRQGAAITALSVLPLAALLLPYRRRRRRAKNRPTTTPLSPGDHSGPRPG